jgi:4-amino-4-deoxy-L-arabinose transferase-like glycosyltransferase
VGSAKGLTVANTKLSRSGRRWLIIIVAVSIALRVIASVFLGDGVVPLPGTYDQVSYDRLAQRVLQGHGFTFDELWWPYTHPGEPTAHWSYLYTLYLTLVYGLVGHHPLAARLIQAVLAGALMPWLIYRLGRRHFGMHVGLVASGLMACYAYFVYYAASLMTESFYIVGVLWVLDLAGQFGQAGEGPSHAYRRALLLGLGLGTTALLRQVFLLFVPVLYTWLLWRSHRDKAGSRAPAPVSDRNEVFHGSKPEPEGHTRDLRRHPVVRMLGILLTATVVLVLIVVPWTIRNYRAFHRFVLLNTNAGFAFFWANHPIHGESNLVTLPTWSAYIELIPSELLSLNEAELDQALLIRGFEFVRNDPSRYLRLSISRIKDYFYFWPSSDSSPISNVSRVLSFGLLWPFMTYGLLAQVRRSLSAESLILYLFVASHTAIHLLSWSQIRYRLPVDAVLLVFAGVALVKVQRKLTRPLAMMNKSQLREVEV